MLLHLTDKSSESLRDQIGRQIGILILTGKLNQGEKLPSIRKLANDAKVSRITVKGAYDNLVEEGLVKSRQGSGFYVSDLTKGRRHLLAMTRFIDQFIPVMHAAYDAGLTRVEIEKILAKVLKKVK